jgi:hypothetical protein
MKNLDIYSFNNYELLDRLKFQIKINIESTLLPDDENLKIFIKNISHLINLNENDYLKNNTFIFDEIFSNIDIIYKSLQKIPIEKLISNMNILFNLLFSLFSSLTLNLNHHNLNESVSNGKLSKRSSKNCNSDTSLIKNDSNVLSKRNSRNNESDKVIRKSINNENEKFIRKSINNENEKVIRKSINESGDDLISIELEKKEEIPKKREKSKEKPRDSKSEKKRYSIFQYFTNNTNEGEKNVKENINSGILIQEKIFEMYNLMLKRITEFINTNQSNLLLNYINNEFKDVNQRYEKSILNNSEYENNFLNETIKFLINTTMKKYKIENMNKKIENVSIQLNEIQQQNNEINIFFENNESFQKSFEIIKYSW